MTLNQPRILEVRILVPVWGQEYIDDFLNYSMQALLLDRNIPLVAKNYKITINFLTTDQGISDIKAHEQYIKIRKYARIVFTSVKDLVVDFNYSTTLTLAYARGLQAIRANSYFRTCFILLNSDFILSNGSLHSLVQTCENGASAVYGASLRINSETSRLRLSSEFEKKTKDKFFSSRSLVQYALKNLHPTVKAMTLNQKLISYRIYTKFYWQLSDQILISHDYLLCCMALVPTSRLEFVSSFVDYSFAAELSDQRTRVVLEDSDDYLAIEIQGKYKEIEYIEAGPMTLKYIAAHISSWTTNEHREASKSLIKFHTTNLPKNFTKIAERFENVYSEIVGKLTRDPKSHINHPHWIGGLNAWIFHVRMKFGSHIELKDISPRIRPISNSIFDSRLRPRISLAYRGFLELKLGKFMNTNISPSLKSPERIDFELISKAISSLEKSNEALVMNLTQALIPNKIYESEVLNYRDYCRIVLSSRNVSQKYLRIKRIIVISEMNELHQVIEQVSLIRKHINKSAIVSFYFSNHKMTHGSASFADILVELPEILEFSGTHFCTYSRSFLNALIRHRNFHFKRLQRHSFKHVFHIAFSLVLIFWINTLIIIVNLLFPFKIDHTITPNFDTLEIDFNE